MSGRASPEATLRRLLRDARAEEPAELDFARVERRLLQKIAREAPAAPKQSRRALGWGALGMAACAALWLARSEPPASSPRAASAVIEATGAELHRSGDALAIGERVSAVERAVTVEHAGRASWRLSPNASALLVGKGERISVRLEHGSVLSEVVPSSKPETFVIEAGLARVAVHGTVFRVELARGHVLVEVREGVVKVGPLDGKSGFELRAPASGEFALDGRSGRIDGEPVSEPEARPTEPSRPARLRASSPSPSGAGPSPSSSAELSSEPSISDIEAGFVRVVDLASDCFARHTRSADGVQITVRTAVSLELAASGAVTRVEFQPPLSPDAEACAIEGIKKVEFAPSLEGTKVTRLLELKR